METFNEKSCLSDLFKLIENWNQPIIKFYIGIEKEKIVLNKILERALPHRRIELLYSQLNKINNSIQELIKPYEKPNPSDQYYDEEQENWYDLKRTVFYQYSIGNNPPISYFKEIIEKVFADQIHHLKFLIEQGFHDVDEIKFGDPSEVVANKTLTSLLQSVNNETIGKLEAKKYVESLLDMYQIEGVSPEATRLFWNGTPGEFGAIFDALIKNGYITKIKDLKNTVKLLHSTFEIKNEKGVDVSFDYLYSKCFFDKKKSYYSTEFKIPPSDNHNKD